MLERHPIERQRDPHAPDEGTVVLANQDHHASSPINATLYQNIDRRGEGALSIVSAG
jgi:hypothetical protein